ncbi:hypothetical protein D3C77_398670 [compost metagenome]
MLDHLFDQVLVQLLRLAGDAEGPVAQVTPRSPGDLADLGGVQPAGAPPVELPQSGEGHMVHVHVQPHADGVGGDQEVDLARLEQLDLGVAGARAQGPHDHRRPAPLAAQQFGDGVDLLGREGDHGAAAGQAGQLLRPGVAQGREPLARHDLRIGNQRAHQRRHRPGAQEHGLEPAARVQQPLRKDMAALGIGDQLDLVHRQEVDRPLQRHGLDGADEIGRARRDDLLLAGDQGDRGRPAPRHDQLIDLARQQPQRQADHARAVAQHPLDRQVGLAGVGGAQDRRDARWGQACGTVAHDRPKVANRARLHKRRRSQEKRARRMVSGTLPPPGTRAKRIMTESATLADSGFVPYQV